MHMLHAQGVKDPERELGILLPEVLLKASGKKFERLGAFDSDD